MASSPPAVGGAGGGGAASPPSLEGLLATLRNVEGSAGKEWKALKGPVTPEQREELLAHAPRPPSFNSENIGSLAFNPSEYIYEIYLGDLAPGNFYRLNDTIISVTSGDGKKLSIKRFDGAELPFDPSRDPTIKFYSKHPLTLLQFVSKESLSEEDKKEAIRRITEGENLNRVNSEGKTALMIALERGHGTIAAALIAGVSNLAAASSDGKNAYNYFCENKSEYRGKDTVRVMFASHGFPKEGSACALQGGRRSQRTKKARTQTRRRHAKKNRKSKRITRK